MLVFRRLAALAVVAVPALASAHPDDCPALRATRVGGDAAGGGLPLTSLFKCHADPDSYPAALAGLGGKLSRHPEGVEGVVTLADTDYLAYVSRPFHVSGPSFYAYDGRYFACVTLQSQATEDGAAGPDGAGAADGEVVADAAQTPVTGDRLLLASVTFMEQEQGDDAGSQDTLPLQARNPHGLPKPQPVPFENTPEGIAEGRKNQQEKANQDADKKGQSKDEGGDEGHKEEKGQNAKKQ